MPIPPEAVTCGAITLRRASYVKKTKGEIKKLVQDWEI